MALRFATELSAFGSSGSGGGFDDIDVAAVVAVGAVAEAEPVSPAERGQLVCRWLKVAKHSPTEALVWPAPRSHGFGGDGEAISPTFAATHRAVIGEFDSFLQDSRRRVKGLKAGRRQQRRLEIGEAICGVSRLPDPQPSTTEECARTPSKAKAEMRREERE